MKTNLLSLALLLISLASVAQTDDADKAAVRKVVEAETRAYLDANAALMLAQWSDKPYVERQHASLIPMLKVPFLKGPTLKLMVGSYMKTIKPSTHTRRQSDYEAHVSGDMAWITYTQEDLNEAGAVVKKERELRVLEREAGNWKIVVMSFQPMD